ncbi:MAG: insulinase family protein [Cytophagales bacterium]|nr:insulinase family protein [Cytophagales bacterium]
MANSTREDCRKYYETWFRPNISYLVVVGDLSLAETKKLVSSYFGKWKKAETPKQEFAPALQPEKTQIVMVDKDDAVQSVIQVGYPITYTPGSPDAIPASVMNFVLGGGASSRLFMNLREDKAYTYGAYSSLSSDEYMGRFGASASVRNAVTDSAVQEIMAEMKKMREDTVSTNELARTKNYLMGSFARSLEDKQTVGNFALNIERYKLPKDYYQNYLKNLEAVNKVDVGKMAQKYILPEQAYIIVVGKKSETAQGLERFGEVIYYDKWGKKME